MMKSALEFFRIIESEKRIEKDKLRLFRNFMS